MPPKAKVTGRGRKPAKRAMAENLPAGEILTDTGKKTWKLGDPIGQGGFGLIYLAEESSAKSVGANASYVIKIEPSENGPLFSELKFYMRAAKPDLIQSWKKSHKLKNLGVPRYWGSGLHEKNGKKYRFMVIDRLGTDLQKKFEECGRRFPRKLVLQLGLCVLDILEYIHEHEYVHADIKASNLMLCHKDPNKVYLVDYGLAYRYAPDGIPKEYKEDPKRCHDGTIEFTSIDAHKGASPCRRSDLEILSYCMVQWLCGQLPWEDKLQDALYVKDWKIRSQENIPEFMDKCFSSQEKPVELQSFMEEVKALGYQDKPSYEKLRSILLSGLKAIRAENNLKLEFLPAKGAALPAKASKHMKAEEKKLKRKSPSDDAKQDETDGSVVKKKKVLNTSEENGLKKSPSKKTSSQRAKSSVALKSKPMETDSQTSSGSSKKGRTRSKKAATS